MSVVIVTGSAGLIGSEAVRHFAALGLDIVGIDNDMRAQFFGPEASTAWNVRRLTGELGDRYTHCDVDIRDRDALARIFTRYGRDIALVVNTAAQPSHDWALQTRWEIEPGHPYEQGIREDMSIDACLHSVFGASKVAADVMVQEYGRYFDMRTACFRGGTLTGPAHAATELHGFLGYVMRCNMERRTYKIFGYQGKMVRDAIHSHDVVAAFEAFFRAPREAAVYNLGGGRHSNCSHLEAFELAEKISGTPMVTEYHDANRVGDHQWWIGSNAAFQRDYPQWKQVYDVPMILQEIYEANRDRWTPAP